MDFAEMFRVLCRRWRVAVPGLLLSVIAAAAMWTVWPTTYQSQAEITLIASQSLAASPNGGHNPYVMVSNLDPMADILATSLSSEQSAQQAKSLGVEYPYTAEVPPSAAGPFIAITVTGKDRSVIQQSMPIAVKFAEQELRELQDAVSATSTKNLIGAVVIAQPSTPAPVLKGKIEADAGVTIIALIAVLLLSFAAEGRARRRSRDRRMSRDDVAPHSHRQPAKVDWHNDARESARVL